MGIGHTCGFLDVQFVQHSFVPSGIPPDAYIFANSLLYVDYIHGLPRFGGYDSCLVLTFGLTRFTRAFPVVKRLQENTL